MNVLHEGDCREIIPRLVADGVQCDACITDPPYHLNEVPHVANGGFGGVRSNERKSARSGFMGQKWDGGDIAFRPETWATIATILRPGAFLVAFGGTRTYHRMACAIEDAGFVIQDCIMWLYGSGFPKRRDMLKPAYEPIIVAYKPGGKRTLQVDECRIGYEDTANPATNPLYRTQNGYATKVGSDAGGPSWKIKPDGGEITAHPKGRWPANICHDGSDEVMAAFAAFGQHNGAVSNGSKATTSASGWKTQARPQIIGLGDTGSAARFFYTAKAGAEDRFGSRHPTVKPVELLKWLVPLFCPSGGTFLDPFAGSGTAAVAALATGRNAILIEREPQYCEDIRKRIAHYQGEGRHSLTEKARNRYAEPRQATLI